MIRQSWGTPPIPRQGSAPAPLGAGAVGWGTPQSPPAGACPDTPEVGQRLARWPAARYNSAGCGKRREREWQALPTFDEWFAALGRGAGTTYEAVWAAAYGAGQHVGQQ